MASYIVFPAVAMQEISDSTKLTALDQSFLEAVRIKGIACKNYMEGLKLRITKRLKLHVVPPEYAGMVSSSHALVRVICRS